MAIELDGLTREFRTRGEVVTALDHVDLEVGAGECVAVLGVNGAGKTTLAKVLSTLLLPTTGGARLLGMDVVAEAADVRRVVSVVFGGDRGLYPMLSGADNLAYAGMLAGVRRREVSSRVTRLLAEVGLAEAADRRVETYSKGMRQRLHVAAGLIADPQVLLLDEPTVGLDPNEAARLRERIAALRSQGLTIVLTSHYLLDVERLADRVVMLDHGRVTHDLPLREFTEATGYTATVEVTVAGDVPAGVADALGAVRGAQVARVGPHPAGSTVSVLVERWDAGVLADLGSAVEGTELVDLRVREASLEDAFAALTEVSR